MRADLFERGAAPRARGAAQPGVAVVVDAPVGVARREWLRQHLGGGAPARVIDAGPPHRSPGWSDDLDDLAAALGTAPRPFTCSPEDAARAVDDEDTLLVVLDDEGGRAATWARRSARGPTLLLPAAGPLLRAEGPRATLLARDPLEVATLTPWARVLAPTVEVALVGLVAVDADTPGRVLVDVGGLEAAIEAAGHALSLEGRRTSVTLGVDDARAHERDMTLVLTVERRGLLQRLLGRRAPRGGAPPRLLVSA